MATLAVSNIFAASTLIESAEANQNFQDIVAFVNGSVMHRDASGAFTAVPSGPASDPISDNQLARKRYVDVPFGLTVSTAFNVGNNVNTAVTGFVAVQSRRVTMVGTGMTISEAGVYRVTGRGSYPSSAGGTRRTLLLFVNGANDAADVLGVNPPSTSGYGATPAFSTVLALSAGATLAMHTLQDSGGNLAGNFLFFAEKIPGTS